MIYYIYDILYMYMIYVYMILIWCIYIYISIHIHWMAIPCVFPCVLLVCVGRPYHAGVGLEGGVSTHTYRFRHTVFRLSGIINVPLRFSWGDSFYPFFWIRIAVGSSSGNLSWPGSMAKKKLPEVNDSTHGLTIQEVMPFVLLEIFPNQLFFVKAVDVAMMFQPSNKGPNKRWSPPHGESLCITWKTTTHLSRNFWIKDPVTLIHKKGHIFFRRSIFLG